MTSPATRLSAAKGRKRGNPTIADAILDRLVHNAYRIELTGDSMRKRPAPKTRKQLRLDQKRNSNQTSTMTQVIQKGRRLQIGTPAGMKLEWVAGN